MDLKSVALWLGSCTLLGCSSLPTDYPRPVSTALPDTADTRLGQRAGDLTQDHSGLSGFYLIRDGVESLAARLQLTQATERSIDLQYCEARVVADTPEKATQDFDGHDPELVVSKLRPIVQAAEAELLVISPYFVPRETGVELFRSLRERGVRVVILTNSLASTDVTPVHTAYARYRDDLLELGVEMWEVKEERRRTRARSKLGISDSSLHAKAFIVDRRYLFVGSFNWDPRSQYINTEMGISFDSPELAGSTSEEWSALLPKVAYRVELDADGDLQWTDFTQRPTVIHTKEPDAGFWLRRRACFYRFVPIEGQL